jgi:hypothetical protein
VMVAKPAPWLSRRFITIADRRAASSPQIAEQGSATAPRESGVAHTDGSVLPEQQAAARRVIVVSA